MRINLLRGISIKLLKCLLPLFLFACSEKSSLNSQNTDTQVGWQSAGLKLTDSDDGGIIKLFSAGNYLFALDRHTIGYGTDTLQQNWRMWKGDLNSGEWVNLSMPNVKCIPQNFYSYKENIYISTLCGKDFEPSKYDGLWKYDVNDSKWSRILSSVDGLIDSNKLVIGNISEYKGSLIMNTSSGNNDCLIWLGNENGETLKTISCPIGTNTIQLLEVGDDLYAVAATSNKIFRYRENLESWESVPAPREEKRKIGAAAVHNGHLIIGYDNNYNYKNGIFRLDTDNWTNLTPIYMYGDTLALSDAPALISSIYSYGDWLMIGGSDLGFSMPAFWQPIDSTVSQFGDWRIVYDNWSETAGTYFQSVRTFDMLGIGDTLYVAAWVSVAKLPMSEIKNLWKYKYKKEVYPHLQNSSLE